MSEVKNNDKILRFVLQDKYVALIYKFFILSAFLYMIGGGIVADIISTLAIVLNLLGLFIFKKKLSDLDLSHLKYLLILQVFYFIYVLIISFGFLVYAEVYNVNIKSFTQFQLDEIANAIFWLIRPFNFMNLALCFIGFNSRLKGRFISLGSIMGEGRLALKGR